MRILITEPEDFSPRAVEVLSEAGQVDLRATDDVAAALRDYDVVWFRLGHRFDAATIAQAERCKILASPVTGLDKIDLDACAAKGIRVVSLRGEVEFLKKVRATAELTMGLALSLLRRIPQAALHVREGGWDRDLFRGTELYEKTAGIIGMGRLGTIVADYCHAFGMNVVGYDVRKDWPSGVATRLDSIEAVMARSDLVSVHVKYDESTHHLITADHIAAMQPHAVLVNTSRGGVIDDEALATALFASRIAGAALDVLDGEPDVAGSPLLAYAREHDNLLIVPHIGGNTSESFEKTEVFIARRVVEALSES